MPRKAGPRTTTPTKRPGKLRDADKGRGWRATLYPPAERYPYWRVKYKDTEGTWRTVQVPKGTDPDVFFAKVETQLDHQVVTGARRNEANRDMAALAARYVGWLEDQGKDTDYIANRQNLLDKWVLRAPAPSRTKRRTDATLTVSKWGAADSARWISAARTAGLSAARVEDLGVALAGMRNAAQRLVDGERWLDPGTNPLEDVDYSRRGTEQAAHRDYIHEDIRPTTDHVTSLQAVVDADPAWPWQSVQYRIGVWCGPRLGEQMALRDIDVDFHNRVLLVSHSIAWPRRSRGVWWAMKPTKTDRRRSVPYPGSVHQPLLELCAARLGVEATVEAVTAAQEAKRERKYRALDETTYRVGRRNVEVDEGLLFAALTVPQTLEPGCDVEVRVPPTKETYGDRWRAQRESSTWPEHIPWLNARHHCATWWPQVMRRPDGTPLGDEAYARWLGHSLATYHAHYRKSGSEDLDVARDVLADL